MSVVSIRDATIGDSADLTILDNIAGHGFSLWFWQGAALPYGDLGRQLRQPLWSRRGSSPIKARTKQPRSHVPHYPHPSRSGQFAGT